ncbi:hypothetical protein H4R20_001706 [Coemansia guatemalensis]|uniref:Uncharacterized protein n=1 Tax=Coemansia guatemalensis TaxID=2761395 RepID=A0A9W8LSZ9_9FUNG|nr:hypothetical protein H4R20_001706 [Coemansia guatemalensis]
MSIPGLKVKNYKLKGLVDTGAKVCLITEQAARRIGLNITTNSRPLLCALWPDAAPHHSVGRAHICLCVDNGPQVWAHAIVVGFGKGWDILVGGKTLQQLGIQLTSPAMDRRLRGSTKTMDHPAKTLDGPWRLQTAVPSVEEAYDDMPDTAPSHDLTFPSPTEASGAAAPVAEPIVAQPICARLGLPTDFFVPERDDNFYRLDALYPEATEASVAKRLHHQCKTKTQADKLLVELMTGKGTVCEYLGGCPPPAAYAPIRLPMHAAVKPIYVVQHTLSEAARKARVGLREIHSPTARNDVVSVRLQYSIDELSQAFAQLPIFTKSKLNTTEHRVLFDDSANNSLNMISVGMQLPTPMEHALFLCDARIVSSVDMVSFFTQL